MQINVRLAQAIQLNSTAFGVYRALSVTEGREEMAQDTHRVIETTVKAQVVGPDDTDIVIEFTLADNMQPQAFRMPSSVANVLSDQIQWELGSA